MSLPATAPTLTFAPELLLRAQGVRLAIFDVDGVLTDGRLHYGGDGEAYKVFHALDGHGLKLLARAGITPAVITGRDSPAVRRRLADLGLAHVSFGVQDKAQAARDLLARLGLGWQVCAVMGDDWPDLPLMRAARLACAPANAHAEVKAVAHHVTASRGGEGAARECCDVLLMASGRYAQLLDEHHVTLDGGAA